MSWDTLPLPRAKKDKRESHLSFEYVSNSSILFLCLSTPCFTLAAVQVSPPPNKALVVRVILYFASGHYR